MIQPRHLISDNLCDKTTALLMLAVNLSSTISNQKFIMKKLVTLFIINLLCVWFLPAQVIFQENFENGSVPNGWTIQSNASDGGWKVGSSSALSSDFFDILSNGSSRIAATNDDACNCDKSDEFFITPPIDLSGQSAVILKFDVFYTDQSYQGAQEDATIQISEDGTNWNVLEDLHGHGSWDTHVLDLSSYAGADTVYIAFVYEDNGGWLYGFAIDNISVEVPFDLDAQLAEIDGRPFGEENTPIALSGVIFNNGVTAISKLEITYSANGGTPVVETLENLDIPAFEYFHFDLLQPWTPTTAGDYIIDMEITAVNDVSDAFADNNTGSFNAVIYEKVVPPNLIDEFILAPPVLTEVATAADQLNKPTDLDFFPILGKDELWVVNQRTENSGGSTLTIADASAATPSEYLTRVDGNAWHFMSLPTGIAFSDDNFNFATSPGVQDANHNNGTFTGPTLWSSDPDIYAMPSGGNGSHLDMLHGSPFSMGIAHEADNVFWVYDDWHKDIVRYDFVEDHGPGNDDHSDGIVRRYRNIGINGDADIPNHMILDKTTGWLYFVDNGNDRVMRLDINSGTIGTNLPEINEPLAEHSQMTGFTVETIVETGLDQPCGIEIMDNRLLVGDYATGDIVVYDMDNNFVETGRIPTGEAGLTGIKIGPDGSIWYTNRLQNSLVKAQPGQVNSTEEEIFAAQVRVSPNPTAGNLWLSLPPLTTDAVVNIYLSDLAGTNHLTLEGISPNQSLDLSHLANGLYLLNIQTNEFSITKKVVVKK